MVGDGVQLADTELVGRHLLDKSGGPILGDNPSLFGATPLINLPGVLFQGGTALKGPSKSPKTSRSPFSHATALLVASRRQFWW